MAFFFVVKECTDIFLSYMLSNLSMFDFEIDFVLKVNTKINFDFLSKSY
jgi:hypothetical protein